MSATPATLAASIRFQGPDERERIRAALNFVPSHDRETWVRMAMAVKSEIGESGFDLWNDWSQAAENYRETDARDVWRSIHDGKVTAGTLFHEARAGGWCDADYQPPSPAELAEQRRQRAAREEAELAKVAQGQAKAAQKADEAWQAGCEPLHHPYLERKGIQAHGTRTSVDGTLLVPLYDAAGHLWNLERISPDGSSKKGLFQGRRTGCYFGIGAIDDAAEIAVAEGFATAASVHEATGLPVACAFTCGNLEPVARVLAEKYPDATLVLCADDDAPGLAKAKAAAAAVGGLVVVPVFPGARPEGAKDFNDLAQAHGPEAIRRILDDALATLGFPEEEAPEEQAKAQPVPPGPFPARKDRPCFVILDDWRDWGGHKWRPGVYHCGMSAPKGEGVPQPFQTWVCSPVHVDALTFDGQHNNFGRLLRFRNSLGHWRRWAMPMELLRGSGEELRGELLAMGLELDPGRARQCLPDYLQWRTPQRRVRCALQVGWAGTSFVLPDAVIGPDAAGVIFQSGERGHDEFTLAGDLAGWQAGIAARAIGNPLLLLALSAGFAGPMLARCNAEGGGIHLVGDSSTGKTTAIEAACSIWGGPQYRRSWRATSNGLEGAATLFNDVLLALDEISECDPRQVGEIVYMVGNGRGKQRASRTGAARSVSQWRSFVLSSGERTLATAMREGGFRAKAGQAVRLLDIQISSQHGAWDNLHDTASGAAFSDAIKRTATQHHGHAGRAFLERLTRDNRDFCAMLETAKAMPMFADDGGEGQDKRAQARFALVGLAGELATEYEITGWPQGAALAAAASLLKLWRAARGQGNSEKRQIAERLSDFLERHGDGRFSDANKAADDTPIIIRDRAGWWRDGNPDGREYLLTAEAMREALKGFDFARALDALQELGVLSAPGADGKRAKFMRIGGRGMKLYVIQPEKLEAGDSHEA